MEARKTWLLGFFWEKVSKGAKAAALETTTRNSWFSTWVQKHWETFKCQTVKVRRENIHNLLNKNHGESPQFLCLCLLNLSPLLLLLWCNLDIWNFDPLLQNSCCNLKKLQRWVGWRVTVLEGSWSALLERRAPSPISTGWPWPPDGTLSLSRHNLIWFT